MLATLLLSGCAGELSDPDRFIAARQSEDLPDANDNDDTSDAQDAAGDLTDTSQAPDGDAPPDEDASEDADDVTSDAGEQPDAVTPPALDLEPCEDSDDTPRAILARRCATQFCHSAQTMSVGLDLETSPVGPSLVGLAATNCDGRVHIDGADASNSYMLEKLLPDPQCGSQMPLAQDPLNDDELACLSRWIEDVAAQSQGE